MQQGSTTESQVYPIFTVPQQRQSRPAAAAQASSYENQFGRMRRYIIYFPNQIIPYSILLNPFLQGQFEKCKEDNG